MIGKKISHYEILEELGRGGMGVVYKARDLDLERTVAIKFLPPHLSADEEARQRFVQEARAASAHDHSNIGVIHEIGRSDDGQTFIVMAYYEGETLRGRIDRGGLTVDDTLEIVSQVASGLARAHENGIIHRDIKPSNIIITNSGEVKIIDFGLAKLTDRTKLTREGTTLGTAAYMSPEQATGSEIDARSDIFSLGTILYEMLAGERPFKGEHEAALLYSIVHEEPKPLPEDVIAADPRLQEIVDSVLAKDPNERLQSASDLIQALEALRGGEMPFTTSRRSVRSRTGMGLRMKMVGAVLVVIIVAIAGYIVLEPGDTIGSVAVLPLIDLSGENVDGGFADGMTGALINELGQIRDIRWTSLLSVMRFKDSDMTVSEFCKKLDVDAAVVGSVDRDSTGVLLRLQLVDSDSERQLWSREYERKIDELPAVYGSIALDLADHLKIVVDSEAAATMASRRPVDPDAHDAYLKGTYFLRNLNDLDRALEFFNKSIEKDPTYANAWAGLAETYIRLSHDPTYPKDAVEKALKAVDHALELDNTLGEAYLTKGHILWEHTWDQEGAREAFRKGFELNRSHAYGTMVYAYYLLTFRRFEEAAETAIHATKLDPLSWFINGVTAFEPIAIGGKIDEAIEHINNVMTLFPDRYTESRKHTHLSYVYLYNKQYDRAEEEYKESAEVFSRSADYDSSKTEQYRSSDIFFLARLHSIAGNKRAADSLWAEYAELVDIEHEKSTHPYAAVTYYIWHERDFDEAFEILDKVYEEKDMWLTRITVHPWWEPIRSDPRYERLVKGMGLM